MTAPQTRPTTNAERLKKYKQRMQQHGFKRMSFYVCSELAQHLQQHRRSGECYGRTLERLLLGQAAKRPDYYDREERLKRRFSRL